MQNCKLHIARDVVTRIMHGEVGCFHCSIHACLVYTSYLQASALGAAIPRSTAAAPVAPESSSARRTTCSQTRAMAEASRAGAVDTTPAPVAAPPRAMGTGPVTRAQTRAMEAAAAAVSPQTGAMAVQGTTTTEPAASRAQARHVDAAAPAPAPAATAGSEGHTGPVTRSQTRAAAADATPRPSTPPPTSRGTRTQDGGSAVTQRTPSPAHEAEARPDPVTRSQAQRAAAGQGVLPTPATTPRTRSQRTAATDESGGAEGPRPTTPLAAARTGARRTQIATTAITSLNADQEAYTGPTTRSRSHAQQHAEAASPDSRSMTPTTSSGVVTRSRARQSQQAASSAEPAEGDHNNTQGTASATPLTTRTASRTQPHAPPTPVSPPPSGHSQATYYRTPTGGMYHVQGCRVLSTAIPISLSDAIAAGLSPCRLCVKEA